MIHQTGFWHKDFAPPNHRHSKNVSNWMCAFLSDKKNTKIYDFGCGMGDYLNDLHLNGFTNLLGLEADPPKTDYEFKINTQNLAYPFTLDEKGIIICLEVGEHLPKEYQDVFLDNIANNCSEYLIISWAVRYQGGHGHYNELNNDEIIPEITKRGFTYLPEVSKEFRLTPEDYCWWFKNTLMVFKKDN